MPLIKVVKIASADLTNDILLEAVAAYKKPVILSVGASSDEEICYAIELLKEKGVNDLTLLHCMLLYPTPIEYGFLSRILHLNKEYSKYGVKIGYSDHIPASAANNDQLLIARAIGCSVIEKHYTHDKSLPGNDHYHALDYSDLNEFMNRLTMCDSMISSDEAFAEKGLLVQKSAITNARRSLYYKTDISSGDRLLESNVIAKRPGKGLSPKGFRSLVNKTLARSVKAGQAINEDDFV